MLCGHKIFGKSGRELQHSAPIPLLNYLYNKMFYRQVLLRKAAYFIFINYPYRFVSLLGQGRYVCHSTKDSYFNVRSL